MESEELKTFLRNIVAEKAKIELEKPVEDQLVADLYDRLESQIYRELLNQLSNAQLDELQADDRTPEQILKYIENSGIVVQDVITKVLVRFRASYLGA